MRGTLFYLSVALSAFGIGSLVVFKFCRKPDEKSVFVQTIEKTKIDKIEPISNFVGQNIKLFKQKESFKCQDKFLLAVWNHLRKDKDLKEVFDKRIQNSELSDCSEVVELDKLADLNNDGITEAIVGGKNGLVNGANNRTIWIVQKIGKTYKILFRDSIEDYEIRKNATNGYQDIFTKHHESCCSSSQITYKFREGKYRESQCLFVDYGTTGEKSVTTCAEESARIQLESRQNNINKNNQ